MAKPKKPAKKIKAAAKGKPHSVAKPTAKKAGKTAGKATAPQTDATRSLNDVIRSSALRRLMAR